MRPHLQDLGAPRSSHPPERRVDIVLEETKKKRVPPSVSMLPDHLRHMRAMDRINGMSRAEAVAAFRACCGSTKYAEVAGVRRARHVSESIWAGCGLLSLHLYVRVFALVGHGGIIALHERRSYEEPV